MVYDNKFSTRTTIEEEEEVAAATVFGVSKDLEMCTDSCWSAVPPTVENGPLHTPEIFVREDEDDAPLNTPKTSVGDAVSPLTLYCKSGTTPPGFALYKEEDLVFTFT